MQRAVLSCLLAACGSKPIEQAPVDAHVCVPQRQDCNQPLPDLEGTWTAQVRHVNYRGSSLGDLVLALRFEPMTDPGCFLVVADPPPTPTTYWPDPSGLWHVSDSNANHEAPSSNNSLIRSDVCPDSSGALQLRTDSGFTNSGHTSWEALESVSGTLIR